MIIISFNCGRGYQLASGAVFCQGLYAVVPVLTIVMPPKSSCHFIAIDGIRGTVVFSHAGGRVYELLTARDLLRPGYIPFRWIHRGRYRPVDLCGDIVAVLSAQESRRLVFGYVYPLAATRMALCACEFGNQWRQYELTIAHPDQGESIGSDSDHPCLHARDWPYAVTMVDKGHGL